MSRVEISPRGFHHDNVERRMLVTATFPAMQLETS